MGAVVHSAKRWADSSQGLPPRHLHSNPASAALFVHENQGPRWHRGLTQRHSQGQAVPRGCARTPGSGTAVPRGCPASRRAPDPSHTLQRRASSLVHTCCCPGARPFPFQCCIVLRCRRPHLLTQPLRQAFSLLSGVERRSAVPASDTTSWGWGAHRTPHLCCCCRRGRGHGADFFFKMYFY